MMTGAIAILVMLFMPMGLVGLPAQFRAWRWERSETPGSRRAGMAEALAKVVPTRRSHRRRRAEGGVTAMALLESTSYAGTSAGLPP